MISTMKNELRFKSIDTRSSYIADEEDASDDEYGYYSSSSSDSDHWINPLSYKTPPHEYWNVQKVVKFVKTGNKITTAVALSCLIDCDLANEFSKLAIREVGGLEVLINLLETKDYMCICGALDVLNAIADYKKISHEMVNLGIVPILVKLLQQDSKTIQNKTALLISIIAEHREKKAQKLFYKYGGIPLLINLCDVPESILQTKTENLSFAGYGNIKKCAASARALYSLSISVPIKQEMIELGIIQVIPHLLNSVHEDIKLNTVGFLQNCATEDKFQLAIVTEDFMRGIVSNLFSKTIKLRQLCAQAIFKSCKREGPRKLLYNHNGCSALVKLLQDKENVSDINVMKAVTGAIWKSAKYDKNRQHLDSLGALQILLRLLKSDDEEFLINIMGSIGELAKIEKNRKVINNEGVIKTIVDYLKYTNSQLLINVIKVIKECAWDLDCIEELEKHDSMRYIWSLLRSSHSGVNSNAGFALVPFIVNTKESGEAVRSLVGGLDLLVEKLKSKNEITVAAVCAAITKVAMDRENLAIMSDNGVQELLARHTHTRNPLLRQHLASAIAQCSSWKDNCFKFGQLGTCSRIIDYIKTGDDNGKVTATQAMCALSYDPINCITLHRNGCVPYLLEAISSKNEDLQIAAAECLANIRKLALKGDKINYFPP